MKSLVTTEIVSTPAQLLVYIRKVIKSFMTELPII